MSVFKWYFYILFYDYIDILLNYILTKAFRDSKKKVQYIIEKKNYQDLTFHTFRIAMYENFILDNQDIVYTSIINKRKNSFFIKLILIIGGKFKNTTELL